MHRLLPALLILLNCSLQAQLGGRHAFDFLQLPASARITALGGHLPTVQDDDVALALANPGLLNPRMHQALSFSHSFHIATTSYGYAAYAHSLPQKKLILQLGVQYVNYGDFPLTNALGEIEGTFDAREQALVLGGAWQLDERVTLGVNLKGLSSRFETYNSTGLAADVGLVYRDSSALFTAAIVMRNIGRQLSSYHELADQAPLPYDFQIGISQRLRHLPFRLSVTWQRADRWDIRYDDPEAEQTTIFIGQEETPPSPTDIWVDNFFRHLVFGGELLIGRRENMRLRLGYNHLRRKELDLANARTLAGFSFGLGIKVSRFRLDYGLARYHLGGASNHLTISTNLQEFIRQRR